MRQSLSDAVEDYVAHRASCGIAKGTIKGERQVLRAFLTVVGNILVENIHEGHVDQHFSTASLTRSPRTLGKDTAALKGFFDWAARTRRAGRNGNPMAGRRAPRYAPREWRGFHVSKVPALLDSAKCPRDRILLATACYLMGRSVEFSTLRIGDLRLDAGDVTYRIPKTRKTDLLPISEELDEEFRRWLRAYTEECGALDTNWYLAPARTRPRLKGRGIVNLEAQVLIPTRPVHHPHLIAQYALEAIGYPIRDQDGKSLNEGMHTIRRSMARALYEQLRDEGDPQPVETVRAMLNHSTEAQTRQYIGLQSEREHRDARIKGRAMFPSLRASNVVRLEVKNSG